MNWGESCVSVHIFFWGCAIRENHKAREIGPRIVSPQTAGNYRWRALPWYTTHHLTQPPTQPSSHKIAHPVLFWRSGEAATEIGALHPTESIGKSSDHWDPSTRMRAFFLPPSPKENINGADRCVRVTWFDDDCENCES